MDTTMNFWFWLWLATLALLFGLGIWVRIIQYKIEEGMTDSGHEEHEWLEGERGD